MDAPDPLAHTEMTFVVGLAFQALVAEFTARLSQYGYADLRPMHGMVFQALRDSGATSTELAQRLGVTKQAAGQTVDELERKGYLERVPHPQGGRRKLVTLTARGRSHMDVAGQVMRQLEAELAQSITPERMNETRAGAIAIIRALSGNNPPPLRPIW